MSWGEFTLTWIMYDILIISILMVAILIGWGFRNGWRRLQFIQQEIKAAVYAFSDKRDLAGIPEDTSELPTIDDLMIPLFAPPSNRQSRYAHLTDSELTLVINGYNNANMLESEAGVDTLNEALFRGLVK